MRSAGSIPSGRGGLALGPESGNVRPPGVAHCGDERVRPAQEEDPGAERVPAREDGEVLLDDRLEEGGHQLRRGDALLLEAVDVRLGEDAALAGHGVEFLVGE